MKYIIENYFEGAETTDRCANTIAEARIIAKRQLSNHDESLGRKMRKHPHIIDAERDGCEAVESWTAQGGPEGDNETDYITIFRRRE